ncbi:MAG: hypothetical protein ACFB2X_10770 [Rivularia sp. (in: cyanobacteria)]
MMKKFELIVSLLGITTATLIANSMTQKVFATEVPMEIVNQQIHAQTQTRSKQGIISYSAADLAPQTDLSLDNVITQRAINLEKICKKASENLVCAEYSNEFVQGQVVREQQENKEKPKTNPWAVTPEISTLGLGVSVTKSVSDNLKTRLGLNAFSINTGEIDADDTTIETDLNLLNVSTLIDYYPSKKSGFRITGGLVFNDNQFKGDVKSTDGQIEIDGERYDTDELGSAKVKASFANNVAPYIGIGWKNRVKSGNRWGFSFNLGVMFTGSPSVKITPEFGPSANQDVKDEINSNILQAEQDIEDEIDWFKVYPVLSLGMSYHF